jgi:hypothetical protein
MVLTMLWSKCALFKLYMKFNNLISNNNEWLLFICSCDELTTYR